MRITEASVDLVRRNAEVAVLNEQITRKRVEHVEGVLRRNLWGRLRWLLLGR